MSWRKRIASFFTAKKITRPDLIFFVLILLAAFGCSHLFMTFEEAFSGETAITVGFNARRGPDGLYYVLDNGHERLLCFDEEGNIHYTIEYPSNETNTGLYIDNFQVTEEGVYLNATEWNSMSIAYEAVLAYDNQGNYVSTLTSRDYSEDMPNKHRFHAIDVSGGADALRVAECNENSILVGEKEYEFENAFNAVYNGVFVEDMLYLSSKDRCIYAIDLADPKASVELVYDARAVGEDDCVPYYLTADKDGNLYYLDVKGSTVRKVDLSTKKSSIVWDETGSLTVNVADNGDFLLLEGDGLRVGDHTAHHSDDPVEFSVLKKTPLRLVLQACFIASVAVLAVVGLIMVIRLAFFLIKKEYRPSQIISIWVLSAVIIVSAILCGSLLQSFRQSYYDKLREQTVAAAYMVASRINTDTIDQVENSGGFTSAGYNDLVQVMEDSFPMDIEFYRQAYCNILVLDDSGESGHAIAYLDQAIGDYLPLDEVETAEVQEVYDTGNSVWNTDLADISGTYMSVKVPIYDKGKVVGVVAVGVETYLVSNEITEMEHKSLLSAAVIVMLLWILLNETMSFNSNREYYLQEISDGNTEALPGHQIRLLIFLVFAAYNLTATFLPVFLLRQTDIFPAASQDFLGALPITINIFLIGLMSLFCAPLIRRLGFRRVTTISTLCSFAGNLIIFLMPNYATIALGLILDGIGVGLITNAIYTLLTYIKDEISRMWGLSVYNSAYLSGINCGMLLGSLLAANIGQQLVFLFVALNWIALMLVSGAIVKAVSSLVGEDGAEEEAASAEAEKAKGISMGRFVLSRPVLSLIVLIQNPYIVFGSFVFYFVPLYCDNAGLGETVCSLLIMLYSQVAILAGDGAIKTISQRLGHRGIYLALGINVVAIALIVYSRSISSLIVALVLLGLSASFGKPMQQSFFLSLEQTRLYGEDRAMGVYNFSENIGESLGPLIIGRVVSGLPAVGFLSVVSLCGVGHFMLNRKETKE